MKKSIALILTLVMLTCCTGALADGLFGDIGSLVGSVFGGSDGFESTDFKGKIDKIEAFFDDYCAFMKKYLKNPDDIGLLADYATMTASYAEAMSALDAIDEKKLTDDELAYYNAAILRIDGKLIKLGLSLQ